VNDGILIYGILSSIFCIVTFGVVMGLQHLDNISHNIEVIARAVTKKD